MVGARSDKFQHQLNSEPAWTCPAEAECADCVTRKCFRERQSRTTPEFRRQAIRLVFTSDLARQEFAENLDVVLSTPARLVNDERDSSEPAGAMEARSVAISSGLGAGGP
jgi:predicted DNA-binding protein (UPF0251 family)